LDQFSPRQSRPHFKIASIAAAGASQSKDRNDKQKTGFFDSIGRKLRHYRKAPAKAIAAAPERPASGNAM
jgi:hypothetical protein